MARKPVTDMSAWPSLTLEGNLIAPAMVATIDRREAAEQNEADYRIRKGLTLREEISTAFRVGQSHFDTFAKIEHPSAEATRRFVRAFLLETFGFDDLSVADGALSFIAGERVPIVVVPPSDEKLDRRSPTLSVDRSRSPNFALQDYLNEHEQTLWGLVTNGTLIRLVRDNASLTRPAYIEADLAQIFTNEDAASFAVLWLLIHRSRFGVIGAPATDCALERWRDAGSREGEVARDRLADQVQIALKVLGSGFLEANPDLAVKLKSGEVNLTDWFNELLRLVYRLIFLMVAEDRNLLHPEKAAAPARRLYAEGYSLAALRVQCYRAASWEKHHDRYEGIKIVFRALAHGQEVLGLPALGGLFSDDKLPHLETARLRNKAFMEALYRLSWLTDKNGMVPVNWRAMETEELGSVYESLLELQPQLGDDGKSLVFASEVAEQKGNQRKTTGSYYTPDSLVQTLLDTALDPVLDKTEAEAEDPARALLKLSIIDPACGSGHFLLAAARRIATRLARYRADGTPALSDFRHALRDVARSCLHGVDRNPMAVELTKVALWIETVDPGLPLGFFDAQIRCGDALLGVFDLKVLEDGIPDAAYKPLTGDDKDTAKYYARANRDAKAGQGQLDFAGGRSRLPAIRPIATEYTGFRALGEDTLEDIITKDRRFRTIRESEVFHKAEMACDLYIAAFLMPKTGGVPTSRGTRLVPTTSDVWQALDDGQVWGPIIGQATVAHRARAFHWPLEFPDVMQRGGFDVVLGNPPWEVIQFSDEEFFSIPAPQIAVLPGAKRKKAIVTLEATNPTLWDRYRVLLREVEGTKEFVKSSGRFSLTAFGKLNLYALFAELAMRLANDTGRSGVIVQSGIATDEGNKHFFEHLVSNNKLACLYDFENREKLFPIHSSMKFAILVLGKDVPQAEFVFFATNTNQINEYERRFRLSVDDIKLINPNTKTCPVFRSKMDADLTKYIYLKSGSFINNSVSNGNGWRVELIRILNLTDDSHLFQTQQELLDLGAEPKADTWFAKDGASFLPLYEPKMIHHYDHRWASYDPQNEAFSDVSGDDHRSPKFFALPRWWVERRYIDEWLVDRNWTAKWLFGWRDTTNATNERTTIATVFPVCAVGNNLPLIILDKRHQPRDYAVLLANMSSLPFDYTARQKIGGTHLNYFLLEQLPVLPLSYYNQADFDFIVRRVVELTYTSHSMAPFARDLGHEGPPFDWDENRRAHLRAELDAFYARAYTLTRDELRYILDPSDVKGPNYPSETFRVLKEKEIRQHGFYRTQRLVLDAWDRMEADGTVEELGPADVAITTAAPVSVELPPLDSLRRGAWLWPTSVKPRDRLRYAAQYALWLMKADDSARVRFLVASLAEPALLTPLLIGSERTQWIWLVGPEAQPAQGVVRLRPAINEAWRSMFETLLTSGQLTELAEGTWTRGPHFNPAGLQTQSADAQRAAFAIRAVRNIDIGSLAAAVAQEDNVIWARFGHAG
ncbi:Eco57I restriction-modification methylase domain-containing protein [Phyllobacterium endophyticum]|uniref:Eco57I restriction-modification methylase domain-containing protein n=1 Tax=Phyllobacterium endophyticum TaxID=1149773 RepID=UPI0011C9F9F1|nr:N-6 DNA methylase [Phyllobacterium endophyticum]TXR49472.1 N-6 DNA methylase [Phyllobacterium endophyticum]